MYKLFVSVCLCLVVAVSCGGGVNWESRLDNWTYADAVEEYGEERSSQELPDGGTMYYWYGKWADRLMLEFGPDGKLRNVEDH
ncbi:MAG: hypothetical protein D6E12_14955 [Desulfovibrio sp.]|nr:MAG: hypothetical protein D6E12_14955 [Desulfovibrio sp.]